MKSKIVHADYNEELGSSTVTKSNKYGTFTGVAYLNPEDADIANRFDGIAFAEYKADVKAHKAKVNALRERYLGARMVYTNLLQAHSEDDEVMQAVLRQVNVAKHEYMNARERFRWMKGYYKDFVDNHIGMRRAIRDRFNRKVAAGADV